MDRPEGALPLPPLGALRAFEAAARLHSFTGAARELCVTQTAVSHQVRLLEQTLGAKLFVRRPREIQLTEQGRQWATALRDVFARLYAANRELRFAQPKSQPSVAVTVLPSFASRWLVPRLGRFLEAHPNVDLRFSPSADLIDLSSSQFDVGIRYGRGKYAGSSTELLCGDAWVPVCAPSVAGRKKLRTVADLTGLTLLHDDDSGWKDWFRARGTRDLNFEGGPMLTDSGMVVEAAIQGQGVGLVRLSLAADALAAGQLLRLFPRILPLPTKYSYYLVLPRGRPMRAETQAFCAWVRGEISTLRKLGL